MTVLAVLLAMTAALGVGYLFGLRAGAQAPSWRQRTSRAALVKQAATLAALVAVYRLRAWLHPRAPQAGLRRGVRQPRRAHARIPVMWRG
ncbi:hypothetical protein [Mycolicibacterium duvalii]|nr:hypothetical protein [Mycolicibacterium duvalii]MCV7368550.1 hypothetical protein [Mycolicibacterium duvalii]